MDTFRIISKNYIPYLHLSWNGIAVKDHINGTELTFPREIPICPLHAPKVRRILSENFSAHLLARHLNVYQYVSVTHDQTPTNSTAPTNIYPSLLLQELSGN